MGALCELDQIGELGEGFVGEPGLLEVEGFDALVVIRRVAEARDEAAGVVLERVGGFGVR